MRALLSYILLFVVSSVSSAKLAIDGLSVSYEDLPKLVKEKNENVMAARSSVRAQEERTGRVARSFLPSISARLGTERFQTGSEPLKQQEYWKVEGSINLYRGGKDRIEEEIRKSHARQAGSDYSREFNYELKEARQTYWKLIAVTQLIQDRKDATIRNETNLKSSRRRAGAGVSTAADTLQFELHKTLLNQELKRLELQRDFLLNQLSVAIGFSDHENLKIDGSFPHPDENTLMIEDLKIENQLDVKILKEKQSVEQLKRDQNSRWFAPHVDLYAGYGLPSLSEDYRSAQVRDRESTVGVRLGFDLGQSIEDRTEARSKALEAEALQNRAAHQAREAIATDHELRHDLKLLHELIHDADKNIEKTERFLKLTEGEYVRGVKSGPDLLEAFQKLYDFRQRRTELYRDYFEARAELLSLTAKEEAL